MIAAYDKERFSLLCQDICSDVCAEGEGIGTYNEKYFHKVLKSFLCEDESCFEVKVGKYFADVLCDGQITEIQTGRFYPLRNKIKYYLENTDLSVRIVHPMICKKSIIRVDKNSGEILRKRVSPKRKSAKDVLPELFWLSDSICSERLSIEILLISAVEHRYSDVKVRYRKSGAYDSKTFPESLEDSYLIVDTNDLVSLIDADLIKKEGGFTAAEFGKAMGFRGRKVYAALGALCTAGILKKSEKQGRAAAVYALNKA